MSRIYATATDNFNTRTYKAMVPEFYSPAGVAQLLDEDTGEVVIPPIFVAHEARAMTRSRITLYHMVDMHSTNVGFEIVDDFDVLLCMHGIDAYLLEIESLLGVSRAHREYARKVLALRRSVYKVFNRVLNMNPDWKAKYTGAHTGLVQVLNRILGSRGERVDGLFNIVRPEPPVSLPPELADPSAMPDPQPIGANGSLLPPSVNINGVVYDA